MRAGLAGAAGLDGPSGADRGLQRGRSHRDSDGCGYATPHGLAHAGAEPVPSDFLSRKLSGPLELSCTYSNVAEKAGVETVQAAFGTLTGLKPTLHVVDVDQFQMNIDTYLGGTPDDLFTWFPGYQMRFFAQEGLVLPIDDVWASVMDRFTPALAGAVTGDDGKVYGIPVDYYPWAIFYRKSVWASHGYEVPTTWDQLLALCAQMRQDKLTPIAFSDLEGWPALGAFDVLNLRLNGYDFHMALLTGREKWTDERVTGVFKEWARLVPHYTGDFQKLTWQQACDTLTRGQAGMYYMGLFMTGEVATVDGSVLDDIDFFEFPYFGNAFDAERAVEAPMDVWAMAAKSPTLDADMDNARAYLEFWAQGSTQLLMYDSAPSLIPAASDVDVSKLDRLSAKSVQLVRRAQRVTSFFDRDTRNDWAGVSGGVAGFFLRFLVNPGQDLAKLQQNIQDFWDALPPWGG